MHRLALLALTLSLWAPVSSAAAQEPAGTRLVIHQELALLLNPMGAQHQLELGLRAPLGPQGELLFGGAHAEAGVVSRVSPIFANTGGYLQVSPLSFLVLRAEFLGNALWPIGMDGAGYYGLQGYGDDVHGEELTAEAGGAATGWSLRLQAGLQGAIPVGDARVLIVDQLRFQRDSMGEAPFYYSVEHDLVLAREDWVVSNDALVLAEIPAAPDLLVRAGVYSNLRWVPQSGYVGHQLGPIVALTFEDVSDEVASITPFVRGGYYTHHVTRADELTVLGGISVDYDLGGGQ